MPAFDPSRFPDIPRDLLCPAAVPTGYETCWGFLARTAPGALMLMQDPVAGLADDELRARRIARRLKLPMMILPAPKALKAENGLTEIGAYHPAVLELTFPENP